MALFTPSESPAIVVKEIDLTGGVPNVQSTTGAFVGNFRWGPVEERVLVDNEATLASIFGTPSTEAEAIDFLSASYFLKYSGSLVTIREVTTAAKNATDSDNAANPLILNLDNFYSQIGALDSDGISFIAKYPGELGNSLKISLCPVSGDSDGALGADSAFDNWTYRGSFDAAPRTSTFAASVNAKNDEMHVVVVDEVGAITGTRGSVLETFPFVSLGSNARNTDGTSNYILDVINARSRYVWLAGFGTEKFPGSSGTVLVSGDNFYDETKINTSNLAFAGGVVSDPLTAADYANGFDLVSDKDIVQVDFLIAPGMASSEDQITVVNNLVTIAQSTRKDCVVVASPARVDIVNSTTPVASAVTTASGFVSSSYLVADNNYLKVYDKYNDKYRFIPAASSTAGLMAATDLNAAPWFSPAGSRRGQLLGVTALAYTPTKIERDTLYKAGINPIANLPGQGVLLFGDKTKLSRPSAFDRINVRRLFLTVERAIALAARNTLFEFNDEFTRAEFVNIVEPFLREIKGRRGITDFRVVCDETNNTPAVVDRNEFIASIFIKPARSINYITLNFVAVRSGVDFNEVVGTV